ncbi:MAG: hypothetical protein K0U41_04175 [Gammaproteobacteria bacterium]|nr:hypothetical protein [Gammaproteobacteria bacterium]
MNILLTFSPANLVNALKPGTRFTALATLLMAALLLAACGGGGGSSDAASPDTTRVASFNIAPHAGGMVLSWTNPARADIEAINISWDAYITTGDVIRRHTAGDGSVMLNHSGAVAATADNSYNLGVGATALNGMQISGSQLNATNAYVFSLQLSFTGDTTPTPQAPDIPAPDLPRVIGEDPDGDSFADTQVYSVGGSSAIFDGSNVILSWTNPQVGTGNISSVILSYQSSRSPNSEGERTIRASDQLLSDGSEVSYIWEGLQPGLYNFTIQPVLGGIFTGAEVVSGTANTEVLAPDAELAPTLVASLIGVGENILASGQARVDVTATKRDASNTPAITFPASVISAGSPSCTATLDGDTTRQYSIVAGTSTAVATYNVRPTITGEVSNCGVFSFTATEGSATGSTTFSEIISFFVDSDSDGIVDSIDVDVDGDGLIELRTAAQLNMMRHNLNGTGLDADNSDNDNTIGGNSMGCGNGGNITTCNGYEQMGDIDLNDLPATAIPGSNWEPIGTCGTISDYCDDSTGAQFFSGIFSGNNFTISNLLINVTTDISGVGFFGAISDISELRNMHIRGGNITGVTSQNVGGLAGYGNGMLGSNRDATIRNSSVTLDAISGSEYVGGLIGGGLDIIIISSAATVGSISGTSEVGGLVGFGDGGFIYSSVATVGSVSGTSGVGGMVGNSIVEISSSVATVGSISGTEYVGGLVGFGDQTFIFSSVATVGSIIGTDSAIGGLAGDGADSEIFSSVATVGSISGTDNVGGLVGAGGFSALITSSVATVDSISGTNGVGGLIGNSSYVTIDSSVAVTNSITGTANVGGLVGNSAPGGLDEVTDSYWDDKVSFAGGVMPLPANADEGKRTTAVLQTPTIFTGTGNIYATWANAWCGPVTDEFITDSGSPLAIDANRVWDLGTTTEYPTITCAQRLFSLTDQRAAVARVIAGESPIQ